MAKHLLLWNSVPVQFTNLIQTNSNLDQSFNKALTATAIKFFDDFANKNTGGDGSTTTFSPRQGLRRRRKEDKRYHRKIQSPKGIKYRINPQTGLTTNDYFFEHQRINGYSKQFMPTPEILSLHEMLSVEVQAYFLSGINDSDSKSSTSGKARTRNNTTKEAAAKDLVSRLRNDGTVKLDLWATVQIGADAYHADHVHENVFLSGVYYSSVPEGSSPLVLHRPTRRLNEFEKNDYGDRENNDDDKFVVHGKEGEVILFPPWLLHGVPPSKRYVDTNTSSSSLQPRVSFAFNVSGYSLRDPWEITKPDREVN